MTSRTKPDLLERTRPIKARTKAADTREGIVEALPGVSGNLDLQADVIMPGAFTIGLREVPNPKMLFDHDWSLITGKSLEAEELMPRDPRLEEFAPDLFEAGYGALWARYQLNLEKELARDVLSDIVFFDDEGEWSIGYETLDADFMATEDGRPFRGIKGLITWEGSFVLFGANRLTRTVGAKGLEGAGVKSRLDELDEHGRKAVLETLSRTLGVKVTPGFYALAGGKAVASGDQPAKATDGGPEPDDPQAGDDPVDDAKVYTPLQGTIEERQAAIRDAVRQWASTTYGDNAYAWVEGTYPDRVIVELERRDADLSYWSIPYVVDDAGDVTLGAPAEVEVTATVTPKTANPRRGKSDAVYEAIVTHHGCEVASLIVVDDEATYDVGGKRFTAVWTPTVDGKAALVSVGQDLKEGEDGELDTTGAPAGDDGPEPPADGDEPDAGLDDLDVLEFEQIAATVV